MGDTSDNNVAIETTTSLTTTQTTPASTPTTTKHPHIRNPLTTTPTVNDVNPINKINSNVTQQTAVHLHSSKIPHKESNSKESAPSSKISHKESSSNSKESDKSSHHHTHNDRHHSSHHHNSSHSHPVASNTVSPPTHPHHHYHTPKPAFKTPVDPSGGELSPRPPNEPPPLGNPQPELHLNGQSTEPISGTTSLNSSLNSSAGSGSLTGIPVKVVTSSVGQGHQSSGRDPGPVKATGKTHKGADSLPTIKHHNRTYKAQKSLKEDSMHLEDVKEQESVEELLQCEGRLPDPATQKTIIAGLDNECTCTYSVLKTWGDIMTDPANQKTIIAVMDNECTCTYRVLKTWYRKWEEYVGMQKSLSSSQNSTTSLHDGHPPDPPGPLDMDTQNDANNEYINEEAWKYFMKWYGISPNHQLDRKHLYFKDEKMFDVCMLSPFSGIVEHSVKKFNRFEEIGYIECQLRRIFHIQDHKRTRMWISEKAQVPRFRQLLLRFRMLNDCIHRDKVYILALEEGLSTSTEGWPTGEPGEPKGELSKYSDIVIGHKSDDHWSNEIETSLDSLTSSVTEVVRSMADNFLQNGRELIQERENTIEGMRKALEKKIDETKGKERFLDEKTKDVTKQEEKVREDGETLVTERGEFEQREQRFKDEVTHMEKINKIQETKIKLDIGGQIHTTSLQTLRHDPNSMLAAMFSGRHQLHKEADGSYFVDRDGTYFRYILNFLRDGTIETGTLPTKVYALREIMREAKYYQLTGLVTFLDEIINEKSSGSSNA